MNTTLTGFLMAAAVLPGVILAQSTINTYAGSDALFAGAGKPAIAAQLVSPNNIAVDRQGNIYFSDSGLSQVLKVAGNGVISIVAGTGLSSGGGDGGMATGASLNSPQGLAFDSSGNLYIVDAYASNVRKVDTNGIISTVAGDQGQGGFAGDGGPATSALLANPTGIAIDRSGNLYIADRGNNRIRMVAASTGIITTIAGTSKNGFSGDGGPAAQATLTLPTGLAFDSSGNLYIADSNNWAIRKISGGIISTVAGRGTPGPGGDGGPATKAQLSGAQGVTVDASGNLYIADTGNQRIRYVNAGGIISTIAGTGTAGFSGDSGPAVSAQFSNPSAIALDASGAVYVADLDNNRIRRFTVGGTIGTFAGTTISIGDGGPSIQARLNAPWSTAMDTAGNLYIADRSDNRVRKVTPSGTISTLAGNGQNGYGGDGGPSTMAILNTPNGIAVDTAGNVYIADAGNNRIRRVSASTGIMSTIAGTGGYAYTGPGTGGDGGLATSATLTYPGAVAVDGQGNVYFTDFVQSAISPAAVAIRRVTADGKINTWVGGNATPGFGGDGGPPLEAQISASLNIAAGSDGSLYIADGGNNRIRKVDPAGAAINTIAGNGNARNSGDGGPATSAGVSSPWSVLVDAAGNLYIGDIPVVRKVSPGGNISTYAGSGGYGFSGDGGPATSAWLTGVPSMALDSGNNLYIVDSSNRRIREVQPAGGPEPALSAASVTFNLAAGASTATTQTFVLTNSGPGTLNWAAAATTTSGGGWLSVSPASGSVVGGQPGTTVTVTANPTGLSGGDYYGEIQLTSPSAASHLQIVTVRLTAGTAGEAPPQVAAGGVLNAASYSLQTPVAPGSLVAIFGSGFKDSTSTLEASSYPWPTLLGTTSVTIGGEPAPLYVVTSGQINAMLPFDLPIDTSLPVVVTRGNAVSAPQPVSLVSAQPGVFTQSANGQGVGVVVIVNSDGSETEVGGGVTVKAGDVLAIYCTGLGDVSPTELAGFPASPSPVSQAIDTVTLTIGGVSAQVLFAGPTPGFTGLYQVNTVVPSGIAPSQQVPLVLSQGGRTSSTVTIPIQ